MAMVAAAAATETATLLCSWGLSSTALSKYLDSSLTCYIASMAANDAGLYTLFFLLFFFTLRRALHPRRTHTYTKLNKQFDGVLLFFFLSFKSRSSNANKNRRSVCVCVWWWLYNKPRHQHSSTQPTYSQPFSISFVQQLPKKKRFIKKRAELVFIYIFFFFKRKEYNSTR